MRWDNFMMSSQASRPPCQSAWQQEFCGKSFWIRFQRSMPQSISESIYQTHIEIRTWSMWQTRFEKADKAPFSLSLPFQIPPPSLFPLLLPLVFSAKCLQRRQSCIWGLKSLFSPLNPQGQTSYTSCQESKLQLSISLIVFHTHTPFYILFSRILSITVYCWCAKVHTLSNQFHIFYCCCCTAFQLESFTQ